ncbi:SDR family NAD(P)-dependent oxidoreductase [Nocardia sp. CDC160]|uniref:SDR family NAD(P)-dependent oxidoreductase n=1 Tax=Nocardia sp. CDC160 TaxID=3112166 RepID=UPI002DBE0E2D|nr:SDR family NAD(P)-dependent oxidoreductase [Nocardia sp. CDC160]MEC3915505.1 SDR family NAD(P)-dependent oxidoreductase [Nocardia sp. CDC160]
MTITVITGANKGLGYETARQLIAAGHTVYVSARNKANADRAAQELGGIPLLIDVTDEASVDAAAEQVKAEQGHIDVLINNAGIAGRDRSPAKVTGADVTEVLDTNVVGMVRTIHAFLPLLQRSKSGVIVNVASGLGSFARATDPGRIESRIVNIAYNTSKTAVAMLTVQYAKSFPKLRINAVDPGYVSTDFNHHTGVLTVEEGVAPIVAAATIPAKGPTGTYTDAVGTVPW